MEKKSNEIRTKHNKLQVGNRAELKARQSPLQVCRLSDL